MGHFDVYSSSPPHRAIRLLRPNQHPHHLGGKDVATAFQQLSNEMEHGGVGREPITAQAGIVGGGAKPLAAEMAPGGGEAAPGHEFVEGGHTVFITTSALAPHNASLTGATVCG